MNSSATCRAARRVVSTLQSTSSVHQQLLHLLSSFGDFSPVQRNGVAWVEEWNSLSQRPVVPKWELATDALDQDFESQAHGVRHYIATAHEITHCLLWEPFFLHLDLIRSQWSVPVGSVSPAQGRFREPAFIFE